MKNVYFGFTIWGRNAPNGSRPMPLLLVHPSVDLTLELYVSPALEEAIALQWERVRQRTVRDTYVKALEDSGWLSGVHEVAGEQAVEAGSVVLVAERWIAREGAEDERAKR